MPLALPCPFPGPWLKLLAEVGVVGVAACGQGPRRTSRPPSPPHSQHHEAAPPVGARGVATRRGGGPGAPGVTRPRGEASPRSGSGPEDAMWPVPAGGTYRCGAAPAPGAPGRPPAPSPGDPSPSGLRETPPARTPQNSGGALRQHPRCPRPRRLSPALSIRPWPFPSGRVTPSSPGPGHSARAGTGGGVVAVGEGPSQRRASPTPRHVTPGRFSGPPSGQPIGDRGHRGPCAGS